MRWRTLLLYDTRTWTIIKFTNTASIFRHRRRHTRAMLVFSQSVHRKVVNLKTKKYVPFFFCSIWYSSCSPWAAIVEVHKVFEIALRKNIAGSNKRRNEAKYRGDLYPLASPRDMTTGRKCEERFPAVYGRAHTRARNETERDKTRLMHTRARFHAKCASVRPRACHERCALLGKGRTRRRKGRESYMKIICPVWLALNLLLFAWFSLTQLFTRGVFYTLTLYLYLYCSLNVSQVHKNWRYCNIYDNDKFYNFTREIERYYSCLTQYIYDTLRGINNVKHRQS